MKRFGGVWAIFEISGETGILRKVVLRIDISKSREKRGKKEKEEKEREEKGEKEEKKLGCQPNQLLIVVIVG